MLMNGIDVCTELSPMLELRLSLISAIRAVKNLHNALIDFHALTDNAMILQTANETHFKLGYLTGMLTKLDEEIAKGVQ